MMAYEEQANLMAIKWSGHCSADGGMSLAQALGSSQPRKRKCSCMNNSNIFIFLGEISSPLIRLSVKAS